MELKELKDYVKANSGINAFYSVGKVDTREENRICFYQGKRGNEYERDIGPNDQFRKKSVSVLVHWNKNYAETETTSMQLFNFFKGVQASKEKPTIGNSVIMYLKLLDNEPIDVLSDEFGHYERVIDFIIYYK